MYERELSLIQRYADTQIPKPYKGIKDRELRKIAYQVYAVNEIMERIIKESELADISIARQDCRTIYSPIQIVTVFCLEQEVNARNLTCPSVMLTWDIAYDTGRAIYNLLKNYPMR